MAVPYNRLINEHGLDNDSLKAAFDASSIEKRPKVKELTHAIRDSIRKGIERNRRDYRLYKAMDWAFDSSFEQVSYTQLRHLLDSNPDDKKVMSAVNSWGLAHLLPEQLDKDGNCCYESDGKTKKRKLNVPVFFHIFVPICMAYVTIRWAKLFGELNLRPHFKYDPAQPTLENRLRAEMITQVIDKQSRQLDYPAVTRQSILQTLQYGLCINFPREAWYQEKQEDQSGKEKTIREGLRFNTPHPSRMYYDTFHQLCTLNSNTGCEYAGYWTLRRYKEIYDNPLYWNKEKITIGASQQWFDLSSDFLAHVYPCAMEFPKSTGSVGGVGLNDREAANASSYYSSGQFENATLETNHFQRIVPADHGLGTYEYPVWFRFVMGAESTVLHAEPLSFDRLPTYTYDADFNRERFRSMTLECLPFQDHISNVLSHWILAVKQNLSNPIFIDTDQIPSSVFEQLQNVGQKQYSGNCWVPFSSTDNYRTRTSEKGAIFQPQLARHNTGELASLISGIMAMLDRLLLFSPQETGQAASHEQTAEESRIVDRNMSTRVAHTSTFIKDGQNAKKQILYDATMAHADDEVTANITSAMFETEDEFKKACKELGLTLSDGEDYNPNDPNSRRTVKAKKSAMALDEFATVAEGNDRIDMPGVADAMAKMFIAVASSEVIVASLGAQQLVELLNKIIVAAGLPHDFRLKGSAIDTQQDPAAQQSQLAELITGFAEKVKVLVDQKQQETLQVSAQQAEQMITQAVQGIAAPIAQIDGKQQQAIEEQGTQIQQMAMAIAGLQQAVAQAASQPPMPMPMPMPMEAMSDAMMQPAGPPEEVLAPVTLPQ